MITCFSPLAFANVESELGWWRAALGRGGGRKAYLYIYTCLQGRQTHPAPPWTLSAHAWSLHCCPRVSFPALPKPPSLSRLLPYSWLFFIWGSGCIRGGEGILPYLGSQLSSLVTPGVALALGTHVTSFSRLEAKARLGRKPWASNELAPDGKIWATPIEDKSLGLQLPLVMEEGGGLSLGMLQGMGKQAGASPSGCRELGQRPRGAHLSPPGLASNFEQAGLC